MKMKKKMLMLLSMIVAVSIFAAPAGFAATSKNEETVTISREEYERYRQMDDLLEIMDLVDAGFYEEADRKTMLDGAAYGMLASLDDPYTFYYDTDSFAQLWEDNEDDYVGVGMQISSNYSTGICTISRVFKDGPAHKAGVHKGDILYSIGDMIIDPYNIQDAVDIMRGKEGTDVDVTFIRNDEKITFTMTRAQVSTMRVEAGMLEDGVGYIILYEFAGSCAEQFETELNKLIDQGAKGIILDLRDNPGGWLDAAQAIGDLFLDKGNLCYLEYRDGSREYTKTTSGKVNVKLVVMVNENSASASELLTGALRDRAKATVVGTQSYGKGIAQVVLEVGEDGAGMQMTVAQYFTPNGTKVHKIGITPDVVVEADPESNGMYDFGDLSDPQLAAALSEMERKLGKQ